VRSLDFVFGGANTAAVTRLFPCRRSGVVAVARVPWLPTRMKGAAPQALIVVP
jgi:hypothetical protein